MDEPRPYTGTFGRARSGGTHPVRDRGPCPTCWPVPAFAAMERHEYQVMFDAEERHFWFRGSRRVIFSWLDRALRENAGAARPRIIDVGAGTGGVLARLCERGDAWGVEWSGEGAAYISSRGLPVVRGGLPHLPLADASFDAAVSLDVFEHVEDDAAAMADVRRVLKPGGRLIATVPALRWLWSEHDEALHHFRRYHLEDFRSRLVAAGFRVRRLSYYNTLLLPPIATVRLLGRLRGPRRLGAAPPSSDVSLPLAPINDLLAAVFGAETHLLKRLSLPIGASLIVDAEA